MSTGSRSGPGLAGQAGARPRHRCAQPAQRPRRRDDAARPASVADGARGDCAPGRSLTAGTTIVSATNGKTTTAGMISSALRAAGRRPVHNHAGSNMSWGVATALLEQRGSEGLFEVDEAWLPRVVEQLDPRLIVLGNLFRDQLDRYGELEHLADEWAEMVAQRAGSLRARAQRRRSPGRRSRAATASCDDAPASPTSGSRTLPRRCPSFSTPTMPSTAAAAARPTSTSAPSSVTWVTTTATTARRRGRALKSPRPRSSCTG